MVTTQYYSEGQSTIFGEEVPQLAGGGHRSSDEVFKNSEPLAIASWDEATQLGLKSRTKWSKESRKIKKGELPAARFLETGSKWDGAKLYREDQTQVYKPTRRSLACIAFEQIFFEPSRRDRFMRYDPEADICRQRSIDPGLDRSLLLTAKKVRRHLNGSDIYGVAAGDKTRWAAIDLDFHGRDRSVFLDQAEVLLNHVKDWHFQVAREDIDGLHAFVAFQNLEATDEILDEMRKALVQLDKLHPDLARRAEAAGMTPFSRVEIYPQRKHAFRLPLCRGRVMLLDRPLYPINFQKRMVSDVESYIAWLFDPNRQRMPTEAVLDYLERNLGPSYEPKPDFQGSSGKKQANKNAKAPSITTKYSTIELTAEDRLSGKLLGLMKRQFRRKLVAFYSGELQVVGSLNIGIVLGARACWTQEIPQQDAVRLLTRYLLEIPEPEFSSRLRKQDVKELNRTVQQTIKRVYFQHNCPLSPDEHQSRKKLLITRHAWEMAGFRFDDKNTWNTCWAGKGQGQQINWSEEEKNQIVKQINRTLKLKDPSGVINVVNGILDVVKFKEVSSDGIAVSYWKMFLEDEYDLNCGHHGKVNALLSSMQELGLICVEREAQFFVNGRKGRAKQYGLGQLVRARLT